MNVFLWVQVTEKRFLIRTVGLDLEATPLSYYVVCYVCIELLRAGDMSTLLTSIKCKRIKVKESSQM